MKIDFALVNSIVTNVEPRGPEPYDDGTSYVDGWNRGFEEARDAILAELHKAPVDNPLETDGDRR